MNDGTVSSAFFDQEIDRTKTASVKWDRYSSQDVLPLWVADMDFGAPPAVQRALVSRAKHPIYGYTHASKQLIGLVVNYLETHHNWSINPDWLIWLPGAVPALHAACRLVDQKDAIASLFPIYPPFLSAPKAMGRRLKRIHLVPGEQGLTPNLQALEAACATDSRLLLFCNPHNPTGRVYSRQELDGIAATVVKHDALLVSDELHCDLVLEPSVKHTCIASLNREIEQRSITLFSPSKTFNLAGLGFAYAVVPNESVRKRFRQAISGIIPYVNLFGYVAGEAAYHDGWQWHRALIDYLHRNRECIRQSLAHFPRVKSSPPEGTYLYWIDLTEYPMRDWGAFFANQGLGLSDGADFGAPGYVRLNFACPRTRLQVAMNRIHAAIEALER